MLCRGVTVLHYLSYLISPFACLATLHTGEGLTSTNRTPTPVMLYHVLPYPLSHSLTTITIITSLTIGIIITISIKSYTYPYYYSSSYTLHSSDAICTWSSPSPLWGTLSGRGCGSSPHLLTALSSIGSSRGRMKRSSL